MAKFQGFKKNTENKTAQPKDKKEFVTWGAGWLGEIKGYPDMPYISVKIDAPEFESITKHAESNNGVVSFMMFPNRNPREGMNDPDYYLIPNRED